MGLSLAPRHLKRYRDLVWLLFKHGRSDLVRGVGLDDLLHEEQEAPASMAAPEADELARDLERLGPTFVKLGQVLSTRPDLLPPPYLAALSRLQDAVEGFSFADVERIVTAELGVRLSKAFLEFDASPLAAASLGQVHRAVLRDGRAVAVKVQRPDVRQTIAEDLEVLESIAGLLDSHTDAGRRYEFGSIVAAFRRTVLRELDYREEAQNLMLLRRNLARFDRLVVPAAIADYTTSRVLTMEYLPGTKITALSPVVLLEIDGRALAAQLFAAYLRQVLIDGFFHADPHPGNVLLTDDRRLALLDLGMVARVSPRLQDHLLQFLLAVSEGRADDAAGLALQLGEAREDLDRRALGRRITDLVTSNQTASLRELEVGRMVLEVARAAAECGLRLPPELAMLGKTLLNLDQIARVLDPDFQPNDAIREHATTLLQRRLLTAASPGNLFNTLLEAKEFAERLPGRVNGIMDRLSAGQFTVTLEGVDQRRLMAGLQAVANRITTGLVLAALIVGAAMLMQVETDFRLFGYPGLAIIFFLLAAAGGVALVIAILLDER
jgi:predicted unusual protein kinase regulating ubiquinone biosynthesis (AarF/ABC1/UbiB family)